jgi:hypothetical protein
MTDPDRLAGAVQQYVTIVLRYAELLTPLSRDAPLRNSDPAVAEFLVMRPRHGAPEQDYDGQGKDEAHRLPLIRS